MDFYQILQVAPDASREEIRAAYLRLVQESHPDRRVADQQTADAAAESQFKRIQEAYEVLHDSARRAEYDRTRANHFHSSPRTARVQTSGHVRRDIPQRWLHRTERRRPRARFRAARWLLAAIVLATLVGLLAFRSRIVWPRLTLQIEAGHTSSPPSADEPPREVSLPEAVARGQETPIEKIISSSDVQPPSKKPAEREVGSRAIFETRAHKMDDLSTLDWLPPPAPEALPPVPRDWASTYAIDPTDLDASSLANRPHLVPPSPITGPAHGLNTSHIVEALPLEFDVTTSLTSADLTSILTASLEVDLDFDAAMIDPGTPASDTSAGLPESATSFVPSDVASGGLIGTVKLTPTISDPSFRPQRSWPASSSHWRVDDLHWNGKLPRTLPWQVSSDGNVHNGASPASWTTLPRRRPHLPWPSAGESPKIEWNTAGDLPTAPPPSVSPGNAWSAQPTRATLPGTGYRSNNLDVGHR